jgi:phosphonoacetaldehyde hydrolase
MRDSWIKAVIFDWGGTTVDHGCFAPVLAFVEAFAGQGIDLSIEQARGPMGLHKRDHIRALLGLPEIAEQWRIRHNRPWTETDVEEIYTAFTPIQVAKAREHTDLAPGLLECVAALRERGVRIGSTTGYARIVAEGVIDAAGDAGFAPDASVCADEVPAGRPAPWMVYRGMEQLGVYPPARVVNVGDTVPDILAGLNAGVWSVGVLRSSSDLGLSADEFDAMPKRARNKLLKQVYFKLTRAGAHFVIDSLADLPALLKEVGRRRVPPDVDSPRSMEKS